MKSASGIIGRLLIAIAIAMAMPLSAMPYDNYDLLRQQVEALKSQLEQVQKSLEQNESNSASKMVVAELKQEVTEAVEWKEPNTPIHMAGYADVGHANREKLDRL